MRILLDTNCLLMIAPRFSRHRWLMDLILEGKIELVVTTEILNEYEEILGNYYSQEFASLFLKGLSNLPNTIRLNPIYFQWNLINLDFDDNKFVDAYIGSNADWIVTYDKHFKILDEISFPIVSYCNLEQFHALVEKSK